MLGTEGVLDSIQTSAEEEILALEHSALEKWAQGDTTGYVEIGRDDVTWFDFAEGEQLRLEGLAAFREYLEPLAGQIPPHKYDMLNPKLQLYGDAAILTFHWKGTLPDGSQLPRWKATSVYHRKDGKWRQVHGHWSMVQNG
jgi:uncharacterized protein (TIGR02246 family)